MKSKSSKRVPVETITVSIRSKPAMKQALDSAAAADMRTLSGFLQLRLDEWLRLEGFLRGART